MDKLTTDEFNTLARTGEVMLTIDRSEVDIAVDLMKVHGWLNVDINYLKDTEEGWLKIWVDF